MTKTEKAAVMLRKAAAEFGVGLSLPVRDARDSDGLRRNRKLLRAALRYAKTIPVSV